ncbi:MAG TPA: DNA polymerase III subunit alpha, partial [Acetobacteraceae bacterium]|nr:DNA polymerase III subunit alpha [Acetobacteraceae bacterium]
LYRDPKSDMPVTQFNMKWVEPAGLVKFDFLGLKTLTVLDVAVKLLRQRGVEVDLPTLPLDDAASYQMLARGDVVGVFQVESQGMRRALVDMRPDRFEDIIALVALYRPGPMANIPTYCARKHGDEEPEYLHPMLEPILKETFGVIIYQEQVMQIAQVMSGYSLGDADLLRRAMGKKIRAEMEAQRETFVAGATARGIAKAKATEVFELMAKFADYGFNKSHAAAYALVAYQTAWMKANHAEVFIAACMSLALGNTDRLASLREEASRSGIRILPPDINHSGADFSVERTQEGGLAIRYALAAVKKVGFAAMQALVEARGDQTFVDLVDFSARVDPRQLNRMQLENLVRAGAFDALEGNRARLFAGAEAILRRAQATAEEKESGQIALFGATQGTRETLRLPDMPDWPPIERLGFEAEAIGFHLTAHPLDVYAKALRRLGTTACALVESVAQAGVTRVRLAGTVAAQKERVTRTGNRMAWVRITDASGSCEVTLFAEVLSRSRDLLASGSNVLVTADLRQDGEALRVTAQDVAGLDQAASNAGAAMRIWLRETASVPHIRELLGREGSGKGRVILVPRLGTTQTVEIALPGGFNVTPRLAQALKVIPGVEQVEEL